VSINKFQEKVFRTGCGSAVLYVCAAVFFGGMFYLGCGLGGGGRGQGDQENRLVAFTIGDTPIYNDVFEENVRKMRDQRQMQAGRGASPDSLSPIDEVEIVGGMLNEYLTSYGTIALAKKAGVKFSDEQITGVFSKQVEDGISQDRTDLVGKKKLKADANAAELDAALKKDGKSTATERRKMFKEQLTKALKDEKTRPGLEEQTARTLLMEALETSIKPSTDELKATYNTYEFKRILFANHPGSTVDSQIAKSQADLKSGTSFEQAIDRYSGEPPVKGKKLSENTIEVPAAQFDFIPEYKTLKTLKQGELSNPVDTPQGKSIYKLVAIKNVLPPDFATNTAKYLKNYATQKAQTQVQDQIKKYVQSGPVKWNIQGLKAAFDFYQALTDMSTPAEKTARMASVVDEAKKAMTANGVGVRPAALAWYGAFDSIYTAPNANKEKLRGDRIEVLKAVTGIQPFFSLRMELVDLLIEAKANDEAVETLKSAAAQNFNYDVEGERNFREVQAHLMKLKAAGALKPVAEGDIERAQAAWLKQKAETDQQKAEMKKEEEKAKLDAAINAAKQKAETDRMKAEADKAKGGKGPASSTTAPPAPGVKVTVPSGPAPAKGDTTKPGAPVTPPAGKK